jgi:polysaccharide pyruvyl transferase WcaK-like protein
MAEGITQILQRLSADLPSPPVRRSIVVLSGITDSNNLGDDAMLVATVQDLKIMDPDAEVVVLAEDPSGCESVASQVGVPILQSPQRLVQRLLRTLTDEDPSAIMPQLAREILANRGAILEGEHMPWLPEKYLEGMRCLLSADGVIDCGGASLTSHWKSWFYEKCLDYLLAPRPLFVSGQGVDRLDLASDRDLLLNALSNAAEITLRERASERYLRSIGCQAPLRTTGDDALTLGASPPARCERFLKKAGIDPGRPFLAFQYRHYLDYQEDRFYDLFADFVDEAVSACALPVVGVPMLFGGGLDEREHLAEVGRRLTRRDQFHVVQSHLTPADAKGTVGMAAAAFGISYHSAIFSLSTGTPYLGLYRGAHYTQKMEGLSELYSVPQLAVPVESTSPKTFAELLVNQVQRRDTIRRHLLTRHEVLVDEVRASRERFLEEVRPTPGAPAFEAARRRWRQRQLRERLESCTRQLRSRDERLKELESALERQRRKSQRLKSQERRLKSDVQRTSQRLKRIENSRAWRLLGRVAQIRARLIGRYRGKAQSG